MSYEQKDREAIEYVSMLVSVQLAVAFKYIFIFHKNFLMKIKEEFQFY